MERDNRLVDFIAAILTAVCLTWLDLLHHPTFLIPLTFGDVLRSAFIRIGAFVLVALILFLWKHKLRAQWGWVVIAVIGLTIVAGIDEILLRAGDHEPDAFDAFSPFPLEIVLFIMPTLLFMGTAHYAGSLILPRKQRFK